MHRRSRWRIGALLTILPVVPVLIWWTVLRPTDSARPPTRLEVSLSARELDVIVKGEVVRTYSIAVGTHKHPTPKGSFRTGKIDWNPSWKPPDVAWARDERYQPPGVPANPMQGVKIYFESPDYFIHGTNDPDSIGDAASHGCIRMTADDAIRLAKWIQRQGGGVRLIIED
ncbi:MAG TPA: L,D-transpeptidase [Gemmatimonadaceae bacterium]|jgi:lipoprotein-anchoring transpeptidase ErfK/SrfK